MGRKEFIFFTLVTLGVILNSLSVAIRAESVQNKETIDNKIPDNDLHNNDIIDVDHIIHSEDDYESKHPDYKAKLLNRNPQTSNKILDIQYCSTQSVVRARQYINYQLDSINNLINVWLNDVDSQEIMEQQKKSLANLMLATGDLTNESRINSNQVLDSEGQPYIEIESSYFKPLEAFGKYNEVAYLMKIPTNETSQPMSLKLVRRYKDKCYWDPSNGSHIYQFAISVGPFVHSLDFIQHLPRELRLSQPIDWHYCQSRMLVQRMIFEVSLRQQSNQSLAKGCPLELLDITNLKHLKQRAYKLMLITGFGLRNETELSNQMSLSRFFDDYTLPSLTDRIRQVLRFKFEGESLPL